MTVKIYNKQQVVKITTQQTEVKFNNPVVIHSNDVQSVYQISAVFNDLSPITIKPVAAGTILSMATICILEPFDGDGASVTIGTDSEPDKFVKLSNIDITSFTINEVAINQEITESETIKLFISPGLLATGGNVYIRIEASAT